MKPSKPRSIWRVYATSSTNDVYGEGRAYVGEPFLVYSSFFSDYLAAHAAYCKGEREIGIAYGLIWHIESFWIDAPYAKHEYDELVDLVKKGETV